MFLRNCWGQHCCMQLPSNSHWTLYMCKNARIQELIMAPVQSSRHTQTQTQTPTYDYTPTDDLGQALRWALPRYKTSRGLVTRHNHPEAQPYLEHPVIPCRC